MDECWKRALKTHGSEVNESWTPWVELMTSLGNAEMLGRALRRAFMEVARISRGALRSTLRRLARVKIMAEGGWGVARAFLWSLGLVGEPGGDG
jgi:hypothetical protein